ncbi:MULTISPECIES: DUF4834 family protein [Roseivirga]|uniref:DUF4834 domain-containing protein n=1 Tax=Roseivirga thermotolerans TaxID=1758176 RepID=A0ABQ3IBF0_9BACT|nr:MULTISPECIES: DUF4834 family protein [Roseivirga]MEC7754581.1 DUF4834 family protein [Bacteroidota bacterium]GHE74829.1 hypothetical protein GCM10011340_34500 [Roseivirga thermotolerans]
MIRLILIFVLIFWVIRSVFKLFSVGLGQAQQQQHRGFSNSGRSHRKPSDGNVNIDYAPKKPSKKSSENYKGGDYVDYEEVK